MYLRQFLSRSRIGFGIVLLIAIIALCGTPTPVALADDTAAVAQVLVIVVEAPNGVWMITDKSEAPTVKITRAAGGCSETSVVRKGVPLCKGDHVITGAGVKVKIAFGDPKDREELTIGPSSDVKISSADCGFICRWFGSWKKSYTNRTPHTSYTNEGTVYEVIAEEDGSGELIVYQGLVHAKKSDNVPATPGASETSEAAPDQPLTESGAVSVQGLQRVAIASDGTPGAPVPLTYDELREALAFSSDVEIASHNNPAEAGGTFAKFVNFPTIAVRNRTFRQARLDSFWRPKEFRAFLDLAKVYNDWGDAEQALTYLSKATALFPQLAVPELWLNRGIALRQIGETEQAFNELDRVISNADSMYAGDALNLRGTIFYDRARKLMITSQTEEATAEADALLVQADQEYVKAASSKPTQPQYLAVNQAQVFKSQGDILKRKNQFDQAALKYVAAIGSLGAAYGDVDNPKNKVAGLLVARARAALADAYAAMGDRVKSFDMYQRAEVTYNASIAEAERQNQQFAQSYCGLASMYLILGDNDKARANYDKCVAYNIAALVTEAEVPKVLGLRRPNAIQLLAEAGLEPEIVTDGETVIDQQPLTGKIKIGTKVKLTLTIEGRQ